jgi:PAS domain S-box-containing protein
MAAPATAGEGQPPAPAVAEIEPARKVAPIAEIVAPRRFLWSLDAEDRFGEADAALAQIVGDHAPRTGETLAGFSARIGFDPAGALAEAIAARRTFQALPALWPEAAQGSARKAILSGTPIFDRARRFAGFRGFAVFTGAAAALEVAEAPSMASVPAGEAPSPRSETRPEEAAPPTKPAAPPPSERGAEIVLLRQPGFGQAGAANVVPIRPGALSALPPPPEEPRRGGDEPEMVELTTNERDAFREIARALGARLPALRDDEPAGETHEAAATPPSVARDLIDLAGSSAASPPGETGAEHETTVRNASALLDRLPIGAMVLRGGEALYFNRTMLDLTGYADLEAVRAADGMARMFRGRDVQTLAEEGRGGAIPLITAEGELVAVDGHVQSVVWDGAPATLIALRRSREAELRALEREAGAHETAARDLATALETLADGMIGLDANGRIVSMSRAAQALFGYEQNEALGESLLMLFAPQSQGEAASRLEQIKQDAGSGRPTLGAELVGRDRRGQSITLLLTMARLGGSPSAPRYCALVRNLTQWKTIERKLETAREQAEQTSARKTELLQRISHEVRTPLHAILGFAEVMLEERFGPIGNDRYKDYIKDIHASAKHVMSLANDLLNLAKIEAGKLELEFAPVDANRIVRECVSLMQPQAAQERIIVRLSLFDKLPLVMADERSLRQILLNLMSNAVKFNEPGGQVIVSTALDEEDHPVIRVRDTGVGMNEGEIDQALEPFRRVGDGRRADGAGLGLPLTKALAEANHAGFSIKSRKEQGTLVEVAFPSVKAAQ